ncbi:hypothetical protein [Metabacillus fastidiosus]|uniref:hypothetical protein n=1 Tax=Metabacillus fastidiosus TaxID=1458 RepID=UPI000824AA1C|nr:hypothetical protein [Metabacillus fastidiosus]MED4461841.1 hypothetical protein [Metabacillus fastidiosus]
MDGQLMKFITDSKEYLLTKESDLQDVEKEVTKYINEEFLKNIPLKNVSLHSRVKGVDSLGEKIIRSKVLLYNGALQSTSYIDNLKDIIGIRLVCLLNMDEEKLYAQIQEKFNKISEIDNSFFTLAEVDKSEGYLLIKHTNQPEEQKNGKEIFKMECLWVKNEQRTPIELQIKSLVHMFWGELEHKLIYKNYTYDEQQSFYRDMMNSIDKLLYNIDSQLSTINTHLQGKGKKEQKLRAQEMLASEFYINLQKKLNALLIDYDVDFREVYILLSQLLSIGKNYNAIVALLGNQITTLARTNISISNFEFDAADLKIEAEDHLKELGQIISKLILSVDIVWRVLFGLYHMVQQNDSVKKSFKEFVESLYTTFSIRIREKFSEANETMDETITHQLVLPATILGVVESFNEYLKMDFFIDKRKLDVVLETTEEFINSIINHYENFNEKDIGEPNQKLLNLLSQKLKNQILLMILKDIDKEDLEELRNELQINQQWVFELDYTRIEKLIFGDLNNKDRIELVKVFNSKLKRNGEDKNDLN